MINVHAVQMMKLNSVKKYMEATSV